MSELKEAQEFRRTEIEVKTGQLKARHTSERAALEATQRTVRDLHRRGHLDATRAVRLERQRSRPVGLAAFLGRITGVNFVRDRLHRHHDRQRQKSFSEQKRQLKTTQRQERQAQVVQHGLQARELDRQHKALDSIDSREVASLMRDKQRDQHVLERSSRGGMPSLKTLLNRGNSEIPDLTETFERAATQSMEPTSEGSGGGQEIVSAEPIQEHLTLELRPPKYFPRNAKSKNRDRGL